MVAPVDLEWIDDFVREIRDLVVVREEDDLMIVLPNQAYKLNPCGLSMLGRALAGEPVARIVGDDPPMRQKVHEFFCDVRAALCGCLSEGRGRRAVEQIPFKRPFNTLPVLSEIAITYRCNLRCAFCYVGCPPPSPLAEPEMTTAQVKEALRIIRHDAKVPSTSFTGGEPTLREDLSELVASAADAGLRVNLITNGTHDALTGVPGSFEATIRGVQALAGAGLSVHTNTTISRGNADELDKIVRLAKALGMTRVSMNLVIPCGTARREGKDLWVRYSEVRPLVLAARRAAREIAIEFLWYSPTPYCMLNPLADGLGGKSCAACDGLLSLAPTGDVLPCSSAATSVGNVLRESFREIWRGALAGRWRNREFAPPECVECRHNEYCGGACPLYWDTLGTAELAAMVNTGD